MSLLSGLTKCLFLSYHLSWQGHPTTGQAPPGLIHTWLSLKIMACRFRTHGTGLGIKERQRVWGQAFLVVWVCVAQREERGLQSSHVELVNIPSNLYVGLAAKGSFTWGKAGALCGRPCFWQGLGGRLAWEGARSHSFLTLLELRRVPHYITVSPLPPTH